MASTTASERRLRRAAVDRLAAEYDGALSRPLLAGIGVTRHQIRREAEALRWALHGTQTVAMHRRPLSPRERRWRAIWETGGGATLDGVSAMAEAGVTGLTEEVVHVSVQHGVHVTPTSGVRVHRVSRRAPEDLVPVGIPRTRPALASVRAAQWAVSDRQAALMLCIGLQQRVCTGSALRDAAARHPGRRRRAFIDQVVPDVVDGAHSLGELDFAALCRRHGLPAPSRQVVRRGPRGRIYLDVAWEAFQVAVEIDGAFHRVGLAVMDDNLRQNSVAIDGSLVLRIDLLGLRLAASLFLSQVEAALRSSGWCPNASDMARTRTNRPRRHR